MSDRGNNEIRAKKLSFAEAWETSAVFFNDEEVEDEIENKIKGRCIDAEEVYLPEREEIKVEDITNILQNSNDGLEILLTDISLSQEKFKRVISLLRKINIIPGGFESEWNIERVKRLIKEDNNFAATIANLLLDGHKDPHLIEHLPRYYREKLNLRGVGIEPPQKRKLKIKESVIGTYSALKGHRIEELINKEIEMFGISYGKGRSPIIDTDVDMAIPTLENPYIIIMVTYQETTASGQTNKTRDMFECHKSIGSYNFRNNENRIFINFVDGGGWLARKNDFKRLVEHCDYFLNLKNIGMLRPIIKEHVPL